MLLYNSIWGVGSLSQGFQAKKGGIRQVGFVPPALPLYSGRDQFSEVFIFANIADANQFYRFAHLATTQDTPAVPGQG